MSDLDIHLEPFELWTPDVVADTPARIRLRLYRYVDPTAEPSGRPRKPVLLLHGASASHRTFTVPNGGLAAWLARKGLDPWMLDWRGSGLVGEDGDNEDTLKNSGEIYNFNRAAQYDIRLALDHIKRTVETDERIGVVGFCMGSTILAEAIALGHVSSSEIDRVVLMTLGLVYQSPIDGRLKSEDRALERVRLKASKFVGVDPRAGTFVNKLRPPWDDELNQIYEAWPTGLKAHGDDLLSKTEREGTGLARPSRSQIHHTCNHLCFMYGIPYNHAQLVDDIHGSESQPGLLYDLFGAIPLHMLMHGAQNLREGQATFYRLDTSASNVGASSSASRHSQAATSANNKDDSRFLSDAARDAFLDLDRVTLITGALNRLWHRDSIDRMYDWLRRGPATRSSRIHKHVLPGYAHQDLLWGRRSEADVFAKICDGLKDPEPIKSASKG